MAARTCVCYAKQKSECRCDWCSWDAKVDGHRPSEETDL
jgi:hypothetical protein